MPTKKKKSTMAKVKSGLKSAVKAADRRVVQPVAKALGLGGKKKTPAKRKTAAKKTTSKKK